MKPKNNQVLATIHRAGENRGLANLGELADLLGVDLNTIYYWGDAGLSGQKLQTHTKRIAEILDPGNVHLPDYLRRAFTISKHLSRPVAGYSSDLWLNTSPSRVDTFRTCRFKFWARYILGLKIKPSGAMVLGRSFDHMANFHYEEKLGDKEPSAERDTEVMEDAFNEESEEVFDWKNETKESCLDSGVRAVPEWHREIASQTVPLLKPQVEFERIIQKVSVRGRVDVIAKGQRKKEKWRPGDTKVKSRTPTLKELYANSQRIGYCWGPAEQMTKPADTFEYHLVVRKRTPEAWIQEIPVSAAEIENYQHYLLAISAEIRHTCETGMFLPNRDHMLCSRTWCGYWQICEKAWKIGPVPEK